MLLPRTLAGMRLGICKSWQPQPVAPHFSAETYPDAYGRIVATPRVQGFNDQLADCFPTACCNAVQTALAWRGQYTQIGNDVAVAAYEGMAGYVPGNLATDAGTNPDKGFAWWQANSIAGHRLQQLIPLSPSSEGDIRHAIGTRGGVMLCVELAVEQQNQRVWDATGTPGSWGGHAVWCDQYDGELYSVTSWGEAFYVDRSYFTGGFVVGAYALDLVLT